MERFHEHVDLDAAIATAMQDGAGIEDNGDFLVLFWPRLDGRFTMVLHYSTDPDYPARKVTEIRSYVRPVRAVAGLQEERRSATP